ncbi:DUF2516 family protein [Nocardioides sp. GY 10127]|uniref:DUF2516 family protein n=1 Tax=Nocardioides sp. GY 10127 TaxID=2569762 RepID=UPI0010A827BD|nr:DUF2516 family protein [Nocardioides sp. GY 10127]TIC79451.1 DUF2516 family protein [Nocardioides sp. GY 10127]
MIRFLGLNIGFDFWSLLYLAVFAVTVFALVTALTFPAAAYEAAGKSTKVVWVSVLVGALLVDLLLSIFIVRIGFLIATLVYLADVRPALQGLRRR